MPDEIPPLLQELAALREENARLKAEAAAQRQQSKQTEVALREEGERVRQALEGSGIGLWDWNAVDGEGLLVPHWTEVLGYDPDEFTSQKAMWESLMHPEDKPGVLQTLRDHLENRTPAYEAMYRMREKSGEWRWVWDRGQVILRDAEGRPRRAVGMHLDITRHKQAEEDLLASEEAGRLFRQQLLALHETNNMLLRAESIDDLCRSAVELGCRRLGFDRLGIWFKDEDPRFVVGSFGIDENGQLREERDQRMAVHPLSPMGRIFSGRERIIVEAHVPLHNHQSKPVGMGAHLQAAIWDGEEIIGALSADNMISNRALNEQHGELLALYATTLGHLYARKRMEAVHRRVEQLAEADRQKDEFLAMLAHELRNPVGAISNAAQLMRLQGSSGKSIQRGLDVLQRQVQHMSRLLDDLLDVSRITTGKVQLRKAPVDLAAVVMHAVETVKPFVETRGHQLTLSLPPEPVLLEADPTRLEQILLNLLNNAAKYTPSGGRIRLTGQREGDEAVLRVRDNGMGIAPDLLPRVFDLFMQADRTPDRPQGGLGIGLTLVRQLVEMHGGKVQASSKGSGKGSEFIVRLPVLSAAARFSAGDAPAVSAAGAVPARRLLLVDDNQDAAAMLAELLESVGHQVVVAHEGQAALDMAAAYGPEAVILDIGLPGMDGYEVARRLRRDYDGARMLLVALTGYGQEQDLQRSREAGFDHHLVKPVDFDQLERLLSDLPETPNT